MNFSSTSSIRVFAKEPVIACATVCAYADFIPSSSSLPTTQNVSVSSRPTVLVGSYRSSDTSGGDTIYNNTTIVNESDLTYTNPVTGQSYPVSSWAYDYATRTYTLTLTDGTTATVCYGDDCLTLTDHGQSYTLYYYIPPTIDPSDGHIVVVPGGDDCSHTYTSEVTREATCTVKGVTTYTCSKCGRQYTESIDALGHDWQVSEDVPTSYALPEGAACPDCGGTDFTSSLNASCDAYTCTCSKADCGATWTETPVVTYGHKTYTCSRCGATKEETENPDTGLFAAIGNFFSNIIGWIVDKLTQLVDSFSGLIDSFNSYLSQLEGLGGNFPAFLAAVFGVLPSEIVTVFWFSIVLLVVVLVWKKWFS